MNPVAAIALAFVLVLGNAFFVAAEFALISARRTQIEPRAAEGSRAATNGIGPAFLAVDKEVVESGRWFVLDLLG